jgi:G3E family GTPase
MALADRIPVTVLTGFLGAGKTTLLNRILSENHGQRIAVIENEFGEIGIDQALVIKADEEIFEMNNGCICCTVRGDLIRVLGNLMKRRDKFDRVVVETTGLANPGPVAQTFFVDEEVQMDFRLDGIVTLVDAKHLELHLGEQQEAHEQVAFADVLVVNKIDLVDEGKLAELERRLRAINGMARLVRGSHGDVPLREVLDVGGFDLARALSLRPGFLAPEYPFEWAGAYQLDAGAHQLQLQPGPDPTMRVWLERLSEPLDDESAISAGAERALRRIAERAERVGPGGRLAATGAAFELVLEGPTPWTFTLPIEHGGRHILLTQHLPVEVGLRLADADGRGQTPRASREFSASHVHDDAVSSVGLEFERPFDERRINQWMSTLLRERGVDLFRMKGILAMADSDRRFVFQGVHMLFDGRPDAAWGDAPRRSQVVFIGRNLDREALRQGLTSCLA